MGYIGQQITTVFPTSISVDSATISGNTTIGGTLGVTGATTLSNQLTDANMSAGSVIQVKQITTTSQSTTTSTSFVSTGFTDVITPSSTSSKILVSYSSAIHNNTGSQMTLTDLFRDPTSSTSAGTAISGGTTLSGGNTYGLTQTYSQTAAIVEQAYAQFLDSPSTTSEVRYLIGFKSLAGGTSFFGTNSLVSILTLMEIAG